MKLSPQQQQLIQTNQQEYADHYPQLRFLSPERRNFASARREELLQALQTQVETGCGGSKLDMRGLSPGCRICTEGGWSCLFINGRCNCRCFYCPTAQDEIGLPTTNTLDFRTPADYVSYLERFGFSGASISGGEPLLTPERSLAFITAIKRRFGTRMHVWLYTNGSLVDEKILARLQDAGLDEIRFDIGAIGYRLDRLALAVGMIPTVTVEIPAIPEELERLKTLLPVMAEMGVKHLNLHQLRLTPFNLEKLLQRDYTYLHGEKVTVLESELMALELLRYSLDRKLGLPINYCSFVYKNRYQALASRQRNAALVGKGFESLTAAGYLRTLTLLGNQSELTRLVEDFRSRGLSAELWQLSSSKERLAIHPQLWSLVDCGSISLQISYSSCRQLPGVSYRNPFVIVKIGERKQLVVERSRVGRDYPLEGEEMQAFARCFLGAGGIPREPAVPAALAELARFERLPTGLQDYF